MNELLVAIMLLQPKFIIYASPPLQLQSFNKNFQIRNKKRNVKFKKKTNSFLFLLRRKHRIKLTGEGGSNQVAIKAKMNHTICATGTFGTHET